MAKHGRYLRAATVLSLVALLQVQQTEASPLRRGLHNRAATITTTDCPPEERHYPATPRSIDDIEYATVQPSAESPAAEAWQPSDAFAQQIDDGQIQAFSIFPADSHGEATAVSSPTYTPQARDWTPPAGSDRSRWVSETGWNGRPTDGPHHGGPHGGGKAHGHGPPDGEFPSDHGFPDVGPPEFQASSSATSTTVDSPATTSTPASSSTSESPSAPSSTDPTSAPVVSMTSTVASTSSIASPGSSSTTSTIAPSASQSTPTSATPAATSAVSISAADSSSSAPSSASSVVSTTAESLAGSSSTPSSSTSTSSSVASSVSSIGSPTADPSPSVSSASAASTTTTSAPVSSVPDSSLTSLSTSEVQTVTEAPPLSTSGVIPTSLETSGNPATQPFPSLSPNTTQSLSLVDTATLPTFGPTATSNPTVISADNIFQAIASGAPPPQITSRSDHPVPRTGIQQQQQRLQTNKFYANLFLGDQTNAVWTHPYSLAWSAGGGQTDSYGMAISHIDRNQIPGGPADSSDRAEWGFFAAPLGIQSIVLSAAELTAGTTLTTDSLEAFSVNANLVAPNGNVPVITMPIVQGMAFTTAEYNSGTPLIQTGLGFENLTYIGNIGNGATFKYSALLTGGFTWLIYVTPGSDEYSQNSFTLLNPTTIQGPSGFGGVIQVAKVPDNRPDVDNIYDSAGGAYATGATISGSVQGTTGTYSMSWNKAGTPNQDLLMFALPHHMRSFLNQDGFGITRLQLITTTKGMATAVRGSTWTLEEANLPIDMGFNPWSPSQGDISTLSPAAIQAINQAGDTELRESVMNQSNVGSMYYDGKALAKFAAIVYVLHELADNITLALTGLQQLQSAFEFHVNNQQTFPLVYDTQWGGVVSVGTYLTGNDGEDFGNTLYNDHHFHYGYFVYAAAIIGYLDPRWLNQGTNKDYINALVRDYANSIVDDEYYPFSRSFDWYNGHSWAKGLFPSADGKDQESSSEDTMASLAVKMWGRTINDKNMEARGNLMLAIQQRSLQQYYLYTNDNVAQPRQFIGNKVAGILFDNKCDHTTYFGNLIEYIQGIHMLPLLPMSTLIRSQEFVQQEWNAYDFSNYAPTVQSGWRGVLMANLAIIDPQTSYNFFSNASGDFQLEMLDGGASQTWYLAWSAALGGSS